MLSQRREQCVLDKTTIMQIYFDIAIDIDIDRVLFLKQLKAVSEIGTILSCNHYIIIQLVQHFY